ncbi:DUF402 domain-containing protein [Salinicoccus sp. ID82-1]|uniref:DUF402 domain-containing protein n=1 Tax=Salinicoccus sp. ID82-1 TaxID=2820269 RepID=UPI001F325025|nr:DUF402 domain-containing protein [Salinicoccus sp. ID82-1]MCG1010249.1 DUF402 domain-containing protein [Salinicoccus sp. ID82-1]
MKTKYLDKRGWRRLLQSDYKEKIIDYNGERILVGLIDIHKVRSPLTVPILGERVRVCDNHYKWLQVMPEERNYSITVMYDDKGEVLQYYFDINVEHTLELGNARRKDIYLDVLVLPDGRYELVDERDLKRAIKRGHITKEQYDYAYSVAAEVIEEIDMDFGRFEALVQYCRKSLA